MNRSAGRWAGALMLLVVCVGSASGAPPELVIEEVALRANLLNSRRAEIARRVAYWADQLKTAESAEKILETRRAIERDFTEVQARTSGGEVQTLSTEEFPAYRTIFSEELAKSASGLLDSPSQVKQINVALVLRDLADPALQPIFDRMVAHENPGLRLLGWQGYRRIRPALLLRGTVATRDLLETVAQRLPAEQTPAIVGAIYEVLRMNQRPGVLPETLSMARQRTGEIILATWPRRCEQVLAGSIHITDAIEKGLIALQTAWLNGGGSAWRKTILQAVVDVAYCSSLAYENAKAKGPVALANTGLLKTAERTLQFMTERTAEPIAEALSDPTLNDDARGAQVRLAVLSWISALTDAGVQEPKFTLPAPPENAEE